MNIAVIFAGGVGSRFDMSTLPKQFMKVNGDEIIVHTLRRFNNHPNIDGIILVTLSSWLDYSKEIIQKNGLSKVAHVVSGGETGQESIYKGIEVAFNNYPSDSVVLIHDGVRPIIDDEIIFKNIISTKLNSNAITVAPAIETIIVTENEKIVGVNDRSKSWYAKAPQSFILGDIYEKHLQARGEGINSFIDSASLMTHYGVVLHIVEGSNDNIKVTTNKDYYILQAILEEESNEI